MNLLKKACWCFKVRRITRHERYDAIHCWFGLTYAAYLVLPRSVLQSTPDKWQRKFVKLLEELEEMAEGLPDMPDNYTVQVRDKRGRYTHDPYANYDRGRRVVPLKGSKLNNQSESPIEQFQRDQASQLHQGTLNLLYP